MEATEWHFLTDPHPRLIQAYKAASPIGPFRDEDVEAAVVLAPC